MKRFGFNLIGYFIGLPVHLVRQNNGLRDGEELLRYNVGITVHSVY